MVIDEEVNVRDFLNLWTWFDYVYSSIVGFVFAWVGSLLFLLIIILLGHVIDPSFSLAFAVIYVIFILLRNRLVIRIFEKVSHLSFLRLTDFIKYPLLVMICLYFSFTVLLSANVQIAINIGMNTYPLTSNTLLWLFGVILLYLPFNEMFSRMLTLSGRVRIEFEQIFANLGYFSRRQKWFAKVFKRLENLLREGNIKVLHDKMVYHANLLMESDDVEGILRNIEGWILSEQRDDSILVNVREILPEEEIKPTERIPLRRYFTLIPEEYFKWIVLAVIAIVIAIIKPEVLIEFLKDLLS